MKCTNIMRACKRVQDRLRTLSPAWSGCSPEHCTVLTRRCQPAEAMRPASVNCQALQIHPVSVGSLCQDVQENLKPRTTQVAKHKLSRTTASFVNRAPASARSRSEATWPRIAASWGTVTPPVSAMDKSARCSSRKALDPGGMRHKSDLYPCR